MSRFTLPAGTVVKINGIPVELKGAVEVEGATDQMCFLSQSVPLCEMPCQDAGAEILATSKRSFESM